MNPSDRIRTKRPDLSPYLFNFLRDNEAPETLHQILTYGTLISKENEFICFTDAPITCYLPNLEYFDDWKQRGYHAMFSQYGIGISRDWLIKNSGARPVIYGSPDEKKLIDDSIKWRFQELDIEKNDFSWLREWRIPTDSLNLFKIPREHIIIIVPTKEILSNFTCDFEFDVDFDYDHGESRPYIVESQTNTRAWKGYTIEQIKQFQNDFKLSAHTQTQIIGEDLSLVCEKS